MGRTYRRVTTERVKTWMAVGGWSGTILLGLFVMLMLFGDIYIEGYSADMTCAGTLDDPCYAYINFTMKKDYIYIYPGDWNTQGMFTTDNEIEALYLEVRDKRYKTGWRQINLSEPSPYCQRTGCKYAYRFYKTKGLWEIRFVGYKKNAFDDIKWSFGTIDPWWYGISGDFMFAYVNRDSRYDFYNISLSYSDGKLIAKFNLKTDYNVSFTPSNSYAGISAGVNLSGRARIYVWNDGWIDQTSNMEYLPTREVYNRYYDHVYYYPLGTLPTGWDKRIKIEVDATREQLKNYIISDNSLILYFGEATSVIKITELSGHFNVTTGNYTARVENRSGYVWNFTSWGNMVDFSEEANFGYSTLVDNVQNPRVGSGVTNCVYNIRESTDLKIIGNTTCGGTYSREWVFLPDYLIMNNTYAVVNHREQFSNENNFIERKAAINDTGIFESTVDDGNLNKDIVLSEQWLAVYDSDNDEVLCHVMTNDSKANVTNHLRFQCAAGGGPNEFGFNKTANAIQADWNYFEFRMFFYTNVTTNYWEPCRDFWNRTQDDITITETLGTSREIDKGLEYGITADADNEINVQITRGNGNQTHVLLTLDFNKNMSHVNITNSTAAIDGSVAPLNNFTIDESTNNFTYTETATADSEAANISTCVYSNITGNTRCYVYLHFGDFDDLYLAANQTKIVIPPPEQALGLYLNGTQADKYYEYGTQANITATATGTTCISMNYTGINTVCGSQTKTINFDIASNEIRMANHNLSQNYTTNETIYVMNTSKYSEIINLTINLTGYDTAGSTYPEDVKIRLNNSQTDYIHLTGQVNESGKFNQSRINNGNQTQQMAYSEGGGKIIYITLPRNVTIEKAEMNLSGGSLSDTRINYTALDDAYVYSGFPTSNYNENYLYTGRSGSHPIKTFLKYNLSDNLENTSTINEAYLYLYAYAVSVSGDIAVYNYSDNSWDEAGVTWNTIPAGIHNVSEENITISSTGWKKWNVSGMVRQEWAGDKLITIGLEQDGTTARYIYYYSKEWNSTHQPFLEIVAGSYPSDVSVDTGFNGQVDWSLGGELNTTNEQRADINATAIQHYIDSTCDSSDYPTCDVPIYISTDTPGYITIEDIVVQYDPNPIMFNNTYVQDYFNRFSVSSAISIVNDDTEDAADNDSVFDATNNASKAFDENWDTNAQCDAGYICSVLENYTRPSTATASNVTIKFSVAGSQKLVLSCMNSTNDWVDIYFRTTFANPMNQTVEIPSGCWASTIQLNTSYTSSGGAYSHYYEGMMVWIDDTDRIPGLPLDMTASKLGVLNISKVDLNFVGDINYTIVGRNSTDSVSYDMMVIRSNFSRKLPYDWTDYIIINVINESYNVTPWGQDNDTPIFNITALNRYNGMNISIKLNMTPDSCLNLTISPNNTKGGVILNETRWTFVQDYNYSDSVGLWIWLDTYNCTDRIWIPETKIESCCYLCKCWE